VVATFAAGIYAVRRWLFATQLHGHAQI
jgi:hypothetical protein